MRKTIITIALFASLLALTACGGAEKTNSTVETLASDTAAESTVEETTEVTTSAGTSSAETESAAVTTAATTVKTAGTTKAPETTPAPKADFASIAGEWFIDGDTTLAFMHIGADGTYKAFYPTGVLESEGTIRYEPEQIEDTVHYWYNFYSKTGEFFTGFQDDGSKSKTDIYMGNGGEPHYQKFGVGGAADDGRGPGEEYVGTWGCGRATLKITQLSDTEFQAQITWSGSAASYAEWIYPLTYLNGDLVCTGKGTKNGYEYSSPDADPDKTVEYTNGSAKFSRQGACIVWNDLTENSGDGMAFSNTLPE